MPKQRILLVEFAAAGRLHRAVAFPELAGVADRLSVPCTWVRFGVEPDAQGRTGAPGIPLTPADLTSLAAALDRTKPTRILFSQKPADSVLEAVARDVPSVSMFALGEPRAGESQVPLTRLPANQQGWAALLDCDAQDLCRLGTIVPSFAFQAVNDAAKVLPFLPQISLGTPCSYERPVSRASFFHDVDLTACPRPTGCSFCSRPARGEHEASVSQAEIEACLRSLRDTLPPVRGRLAVRLCGEAALRNIDKIADTILACRCMSADWLVDGRVDDLVRHKDRLAKAAETFVHSNHRLLVALVGVESFVRSELERMNKGVTPLQNLDAAIALFELEEAHRSTFSFRQMGGFSTVFLTPWTQLEDFVFNLRVVQVCGFEDLCAKVPGDRLRLEAGLPLTVLARRDGLVLDVYDDPLLDTAARTFYEEEIPWRFADPRLQQLAPVLSRFAAAREGRLPSDALGDQADADVRDARRQGMSVVDLLLQRIEAEVLARPCPRTESVPESDSCTSSSARHQRGLVAAVLAGLKPVAKLEAIPELETDELIRQLQLPHPFKRCLRVPCPESSQPSVVCEVYFGNDPEDVRRAVEWTIRSEVAPNESERNEAMDQVGRLLGYPPCCASHFAHRETPSSRLGHGWLHLARRMAEPGPVPSLMNPFALPPFSAWVPCSLLCEASRAWIDRAWRELGHLAGGDDERLRAGHPWLVALRGQGSALELVPETSPGERFRFRVGARYGDAPELRSAATGDELLIDYERLFVLRKGTAVADLSLRAFVWWHERALQAELWTRVLCLRAKAGQGHFDGGRVALDIDGSLRVSPGLRSLQVLLEEALGAMRSSGSLGRLRVLRCQPVALHRLSLVIQAGRERIELFVTDVRDMDRPLFRAGPLAFTVPKGEKVDTPLRRAVFRVLEQGLSARLS